MRAEDLKLTHSLHPSIRSYQHIVARTLIYVPMFHKTHYIRDDESCDYIVGLMGLSHCLNSYGDLDVVVGITDALDKLFHL